MTQTSTQPKFTNDEVIADVKGCSGHYSKDFTMTGKVSPAGLERIKIALERAGHRNVKVQYGLTKPYDENSVNTSRVFCTGIAPKKTQKTITRKEGRKLVTQYTRLRRQLDSR